VNINLAIAERARAGEALTVAEIDELGSSDILSLGMLADEVRRAGSATRDVRACLEIAGARVHGCAGAQGAEVRLHACPHARRAEALIAKRACSRAAAADGFLARRHCRSPLGQAVRRPQAAEARRLDAIAEAPVDRLHDAEDACAPARRDCRFVACRCRVRSKATAVRAG
jgi:hypothetical protein